MLATKPKLVVECSGSFRVKVLPGGRVEIEMEEVDLNPETNPGEVLYDKPGVARRLGTSVRSIDNWMRQKRNPLPFIRTAGHPKFRESDVQWWLSQGCSVAARRAAQSTSQV